MTAQVWKPNWLKFAATMAVPLGGDLVESQGIMSVESNPSATWRIELANASGLVWFAEKVRPSVAQSISLALAATFEEN